MKQAPKKITAKRVKQCVLCQSPMRYDPENLLWSCSSHTCDHKERPQVGGGEQYTMIRGPFEIEIRPTSNGLSMWLVNHNSMIVVDVTGMFNAPKVIEAANDFFLRSQKDITYAKKTSVGDVYVGNRFPLSVHKEAPAG